VPVLDGRRTYASACVGFIGLRYDIDKARACGAELSKLEARIEDPGKSAGRWRVLRAIAELRHTLLFRAVNAAENRITFFDAVPDDTHAAVRACRRECGDRAFEAVESVSLALCYHLKRLVVVVTAFLACKHLRLVS
jgi:hypothetical protein